jgi:hypothetical protein
MLQTFIHAVVTTVGIMNIAATPTALPVTPIQVNTERVYVVKSGESLSMIAQSYYHNTDAWTSILKDNPHITNPNAVAEGTMLKLRIIPQAVTEEELALVQPTAAPMHDSITLEATTAAAASSPTAQPTTQFTYSGGPLSEAQLTYLGQCEAGMDPTKNTGNGYYGAFQFSYGTWQRMETGYERADLAPIEVQKAAVQKLLSKSSIFGQFPGCARKMQSLGML